MTTFFRKKVVALGMKILLAIIKMTNLPQTVDFYSSLWYYNYAKKVTFYLVLGKHTY